MEERTDEELISGYLESHYHHSDGSFFWAWEAVQALLKSDRERAWRITAQLIERTTDKNALAYIAAGPLEDLLYSNGPQFIDRVEKAARTSPNFLYALTIVYPGDLELEIVARVEAICGPVR